MSAWVKGLAQFWPIGVALMLLLSPVRWRFWPLALVLLLLVLTPLALALGAVDPYLVRLQALICITAILAVSLNLINGVTGLFSLGHAGFAIVGAYTASILTAFLFRLGPETPMGLAIPAFIFSLVMGGLTAAILGILVGLPTLRLRGDYLAIATLGFGEIVCVILRFITFRRAVGGQVFEVGGPRGIQDLPSMPGPHLPGHEATVPIVMSFVFSLIVLAIIVWATRNFVFSSHGRACAAIREDEVAAEILGVDTVFYKVGTFALGAFFAGVGGGLLAHWSNMVHPSMGNFLRSIEYLIIVYVGGAGSLSGSLLAAILLTVFGELLKDWMREYDAWRMALYGVILVAVMLWRPRGLFGGREFPWLQPRAGAGAAGHGTA